MRDADRLREKREFSLDDRQAWALGFSALLLIGGVFVVGVLVGRRMAPEPRPPATDYRPPETANVPSAPPGVSALPASPPVVEKEKETENEKAKESEKARGRAPTVVPAPRPATVVPAPPPALQVASAVPVSLTAPPRDVGDFTVQIGASPDRAEAQRMENKARAAGLKPYAVEADLGAKGTWYRVRVGAFKDKAAANRFRTDVERELRGPAVVMGTH
ncbi:MAG: SPOR domain-containing protein [Myxococcales bacterium]|nr:SPOR domain-containing protein [Myxococcales bacterium]